MNGVGGYEHSKTEINKGLGITQHKVKKKFGDIAEGEVFYWQGSKIRKQKPRRGGFLWARFYNAIDVDTLEEVEFLLMYTFLDMMIFDLQSDSYVFEYDLEDEVVDGVIHEDIGGIPADEMDMRDIEKFGELDVEVFPATDELSDDKATEIVQELERAYGSALPFESCCDSYDSGGCDSGD